MKYIQLTKGKKTIVDDKLFNYLNQWKWHVRVCKGKYYAIRVPYELAGRRKGIYLHRLIMNISHDFHIDHINANTLDNRTINLRQCTRTENNRNSKISKNNSSGYKGVSWNKGNKKWRAYIAAEKQIHLGFFVKKEEAAKAYNQAARKYHGEFASINTL